MEQNIETAKGILKGLRKRKMDIEHEAKLKSKREKAREGLEHCAKGHLDGNPAKSPPG